MQTEVQDITITPTWVRSSRCGPANCVELRIGSAEVIICDSKEGKIARLVFGRSSWDRFLDRWTRPACP